MARLRVIYLWDFAHTRPEGHGHVRVQRHPWDGLSDGI